MVRWCRRMSISSLASSLPGHEWVPLPNGIYVFGRGATYKQTISVSSEPYVKAINKPQIQIQIRCWTDTKQNNRNIVVLFFENVNVDVTCVLYEETHVTRQNRSRRGKKCSKHQLTCICMQLTHIATVQNHHVTWCK